MAINFGGFRFDPETGNFTQNQQSESSDVTKKPRKQVGTPFSRLLISLLVTIAFGLVYYYFELPALNIHSGNMYVFIILLCAVFCVMEIITSGFSGDTARGYIVHVKDKLKIPAIIALLVVALAIVGSILGWVVFRAGSYSKLITVQPGDFAQEVDEIGLDQIPMLDSTSANVLANRKLGELSDLVSQFEVSGISAQINLQGSPVRVTYLNYGDFFKWFNNQKSGIPAYLVVDMVSQEVTVQRLENGIKYSPTEYFFRNIDRYLRICYPTYIFEDTNCEVEEDGQPYWVASVLTRTIGLFGGSDVQGAVLVNAITGEHTYYDVEDVPTWVDRVYNANLIVQQYDYYGQYHNGFINSLFGQKDCTVTTNGYNYIAQDDDVWLYTGITSVGGDESNIGFILVNQRTKEAHYYSCAGAEEYSAMNSAQGAVQQYSYVATFPLLLNISGQPTYFIALKDSSSLVKMYAMVNVQQYQLVSTGYTVVECQENYRQMLVTNNLIEEEVAPVVPEPVIDYSTVSGNIDEIRSAVMDGNTWYFIRLEGEEIFYAVSAADNRDVVILDVGDEVTVSYEAGGDSILNAATITKS